MSPTDRRSIVSNPTISTVSAGQELESECQPSSTHKLDDDNETLSKDSNLDLPDLRRAAEADESDDEDDKKSDRCSVDEPHEPEGTTNAPEPAPPRPRQVVVGMLAIFLALFLVSLDRTIISTAIPSITDEFHSLDDIGWYGSAFMLTGCCSQLLFGRIYTFNRPKYVFLASIVVFEVGSAVCGAAPSSVAFIVGRAVAGVGAAGVTAGNIILVGSLVPPARRPAYMGLWGAVAGVSAAVGPLLGGAFTSGVSWRWAFYINLPIGGLVLLIVFFILEPTQPVRPGLSLRQQLANMDLLGEFFLFPSIICLLLALQWGNSVYAWGNWRIILLFALFGTCWLAFMAVQVLKPQTATVPIRILRNRSLLAGMWFMVSLAGVMLTMIYYVPIWLQAVKGKSAVQSGIDTIPLVLSLVVASILAGQFTARVGYYVPCMILSSVLMSVGAGLSTTWDVNTASGDWIGFQILLGFGIGVGMQQAVVVAQTVLKREDVPIGVSLIIFCQQLSGSVFVSAAQNVLESTLVDNLRRAATALDPSKLINSGATGFRDGLSPTDLPVVLRAYNGAIRHVFIIGVCMACLSILGAVAVKWQSVKGKPRPAADEEKRPR